MKMLDEWHTSVEKWHQHDQGDHNVEGKAAGHLNVGPPEPRLVLRDGPDLLILILVPVLVRCGQTE